VSRQETAAMAELAHAEKSRRDHSGAADLCFDMIEAKPQNLICDRAYDSDPLDEQLSEQGRTI
jgi:hypothetical protein